MLGEKTLEPCEYIKEKWLFNEQIMAIHGNKAFNIFFSDQNAWEKNWQWYNLRKLVICELLL